MIGLIGYDGKLPNLALMKISTYYKSLAVCVSASFSLNYGRSLPKNPTGLAVGVSK